MTHRDAELVGGSLTGLPIVRSSFIGRHTEVRSLVDGLQQSALTTLVGPAGVGKTRLALAASEAAARHYPEGVRAAMLGAVQEPDLVAAEVASSLGMPRTGGRSYEEAMLAWLMGRRLLLVLDNCEHVIATVARLADTLLARSPALTILATSREPLNLAAEVVHRVAPLAVPEPGASREAIAASEAVRLFVDRARARQSDFDLDAADPGVVAALCRRLDGLPLAIELAAARVGALAPREIADRLADRFPVLGQGWRTAEPRHRTLRSAVDWSYALLEEDERILLRRLSIFPGSFDLDSAAAVCALGDFDPAAVVDGVARLVDKSLVARDGHDPARYRLLETLRAFGAERLEAAGEVSRVRDAHSTRYLDLAQGAASALRAGSEGVWLDRLDREHDNFRSALDHLLGGGRPADALVLAASLTMFWWTHGHHREGIRWLETGLERATDAPGELVATSLFNLGFLWAHDTDDWAHAAKFLDRGITVARDAGGASSILGYLLALRGECANFAGEHERALELTREGAAIIRGYPDPWGAGFALWNLGFTHRCRGELDAAEACFEEMVAIQREHGIGLVLMIGCKSLAELAEARGALERARALYEESLALRRGLGAARLGYVHGSLPQALLAVARVAAQLGDHEAARRALAEALPLAEEMHDQDTLAEARRQVDTLDTHSRGQALHVQHPGRTGPERAAGLSARELEVLRLVAAGLTNKEIAARLVLSPETVHRHVLNLYRKIDARGRADATAYAFRHGLADPAPAPPQ